MPGSGLHGLSSTRLSLLGIQLSKFFKDGGHIVLEHTPMVSSTSQEVFPREFKGKRLFFIYQGAAPTKMMIDDGEYSMSRFAGMYGFNYEGMATNTSEAKTLKGKLK